MQRYKSIALAAIVLGLLLQGWMLYRSGIGGDQIDIYQAGTDVLDGLDPVSKRMSGGGMIPGSLLQILVGVPLAVAFSTGSVKLMIWLMSALAFVPLWFGLRGRLSPEQFVAFIVLFALSPWRVYHAAVVWEPAFLFLFSAVHLWAIMKLGDGPSPLASFALGVCLLALPQLHGSFLILWIATIYLVIRKQLKLSLLPLFVGAVVGGLSLIPYVLAVIEGSVMGTPSEGFIGKGFVTVAPLLKGLLYWPRLGSLDIGVPLKEASSFSQIAVIMLQVFGFASLLLAIISLRILVWDKRREINNNAITAYAAACLIGLIVAAGLSPVTLQGWHVVIVLHAAILPVVLALSDSYEWIVKRRTLVISSLAILSIAVNLVILAGKPTFNHEPLPEKINEHPQVRELIERS